MPSFKTFAEAAKHIADTFKSLESDAVPDNPMEPAPAPGSSGPIPENVIKRASELVEVDCWIIVYRPNPETIWGSNFTPINPESFFTTSITKRNRMLDQLRAAVYQGKPMYLVTLNQARIKTFIPFARSED